MKIREDYFDVDTSKFHINDVRMSAKVRRFIDDVTPYREIRREKVDAVCFEFNGNWGNRLYTNRETGNKLYMALVKGLVKPVTTCLPTFALLNGAIRYLESIDAPYCVNRELESSAS